MHTGIHESESTPRTPKLTGDRTHSSRDGGAIVRRGRVPIHSLPEKLPSAVAPHTLYLGIVQEQKNNKYANKSLRNRGK